MKRLLTALLIAAILLSSTACSSGDSNDKTAQDSTVSPNTSGTAATPTPDNSQTTPSTTEETSPTPEPIGYTEIIPTLYDAVSFTDNGWIKVTLNKEVGYYDLDGKEIIPIGKYVDVGVFSDGLALCTVDTGAGSDEHNRDYHLRFGYVDSSGKEVIAAQYYRASSFTEGHAVVGILVDNDYSQRQDFIINTSGETTGVLDSYIRNMYANETFPFSNGIARFRPSDNNFGYYDTTGAIVIPKSGSNERYISASDFTNGLAVVTSRKLNRDTKLVINTAGETVLTASENNFFYIFDDVIILRGTSLVYDFITYSKEGEELAAVNGATFQGFESGYSEGLIWVSAGGRNNLKYGFMNRRGEWVIPADYDMTSPFHNGIALVSTSEGKGFINTKGEVVVPLRYNEISRISNDMFKVLLEGLVGIVNDKGQTLIPIEYDNIIVYDGLAYVQRADKSWGVMDLNGSIVIPFGTYKFDSFHSVDYPHVQDYLDYFFNNAGLVRAELNGETVIIDRTGRVIISAGAFQKTDEIRNGRVIVRSENGWGVVAAIDG